MSKREHRTYVRALKTQITPEALALATRQIKGRERVKIARKASKAAVTIGALGVGVALTLGLARAGHTK